MGKEFGLRKLVTLPWQIIDLAARIVCDLEQQKVNAFLEGYQLGQEAVYDRIASYTHLEPCDGEQHSASLRDDQ